MLMCPLNALLAGHRYEPAMGEADRPAEAGGRGNQVLMLAGFSEQIKALCTFDKPRSACASLQHPCSGRTSMLERRRQVLA
jgi:hypothetical protein